MSEEDSEKDRPGREELEEMVRKMLSSGQLDPEALSKVAGLGANPAMMGQMFSQLRNLMSDSEGPINWKMAENQAMELAKKDESKNLENLETEVLNAFEIARLWLSEVTQFSTSEQPKLLKRIVWVQDAMPLFAELSEPVASSMAKALSENIVEAMPEELANLLGPASKFIGNAGAAIFAMQLGQAMGKLSTQTLSATEIGIPISSRPGLITQMLASSSKILRHQSLRLSST
ncbi:MAG: zinc-dependent metalloprotease [Aquiluna sp.]